MSRGKKKKIEPIKTFRQLKTLYQHNEDFWVMRDHIENTHLFSNRNGLWDAYELKDYMSTGKITPDEISHFDFDEDTMPTFILVKRSRVSHKFLFYDTDLEIILNSGLSNIDIFKEVSQKWIKRHQQQSSRSKKNQKRSKTS